MIPTLGRKGVWAMTNGWRNFFVTIIIHVIMSR